MGKLGWIAMNRDARTVDSGKILDYNKKRNWKASKNGDIKITRMLREDVRKDLDGIE
jgi:hypothetical protein